MTELQFDLSARIIYGSDILGKAASAVSALGRRVLIVTESVLHEGERIVALRSALERRGAACIVFDEVNGESGLAAIGRILSLARISHIDAIVGFGGVRTLNIAKAVAVVAGGEGRIEAYLAAGPESVDRPLPYVEIPSTCRNPFMLQDRFLLIDRRSRRVEVVEAPRGTTRLVAIDPAYTIAMPRKFAVTTMFDTLLAAVEGYLSSHRNFLSDGLFLQAIASLRDAIPEALDLPGDPAPLESAVRAGLLCGLGLAVSGLGPGSALSYALSARFGIPKSWSSAALLPHIVDLYAEMDERRLAEISFRLGEGEREVGADPGPAAQAFSLLTRRLLGLSELPTRLRAFDVPLDGLESAAGIADGLPFAHTFPEPVDAGRLHDILKQAY